MKTRLHVHNEMESELVMLGGLDHPHLIEVVRQLVDYIERAPFPSLADIALTTGTAARDALCRAVVVPTSLDDLQKKLRILLRRLEEGQERGLPGKGVFLGTGRCPAPGRTVFVFPGEGSQYPDMLRELCLHFPACRSAFDDADTASALARSPILPSQWIFPTAAGRVVGGKTENFGMAGAVQAVLAADTAFLRLFAQLGITPDAVVGSGVGEISALECVGAFDFASRAERLDGLRDGCHMLSEFEGNTRIPQCVCLSTEGLNRETLAQCLAPFGDEVLISRDHSTNIFGLCARPSAADRVVQSLRDCGATVRILPLDQPYHTPWMDSVKPVLKAFFKRLIRRVPTIPVYSCMTAAPHEGDIEAWVEGAATQWMRPLQFVATIERLYDDGFRVFVEIGARGSLTASIATILRHRPHLALAANSGHRSDIRQLHYTLAELATHGAKFDVAQLHINRGSRLLDLSRPRPTHAQRAERTMQLNPSLPAMRAAEIPQGLVAPQAPSPVGTRLPAAGRAPAPETGQTDFPLIGDAEILGHHPGESIELTVDLSIFDQPFLADSALGSSRVSLSESTLRGLPVMPFGMMAEIMSEAARKLSPALVVAGLDEFSIRRWLTVEGSTRTIQINARRLPLGDDGRQLFETAVYNLDSTPAGSTRELLAQAVIHLADAYPAPRPPRAVALRGPVKLGWQAEDLYPTRLHYGTAFQNLQAIPQWGENGLVAGCLVLPRSGLIRRVPNPRFSLDPVLVGAVGAALAAWDAREPCSGEMHLPAAAGRIDFFAPPGAEGSRAQLALFVGSRSSGEAVADAELIDEEGRLLLAASQWKNRVFTLSPALHNLLLHPTEAFLAREMPSSVLPSLPQEVLCCIIDTFPKRLLQNDDAFWLRAAAYLTLSLTERMKWREMGGTPDRRAEWLLGRIAAKDAVRRCLQARYGRKWAAADIRIETDEAGKPLPQGEWRRHCGARMDISITHTNECIVAAVAPNADIGIDIERRDRAISDDFAAAAFGATEQEIAAESGEGATALFRFWCAKEAFVKALGTGLRYGASDLLVRTYNRRTGRLAIEATRLWTQAFPVLRNKPIYVHSCLLDNIVLAVCVLDSGLLQETRLMNPDSTLDNSATLQLH